jgi:hypothetical protein
MSDTSNVILEKAYLAKIMQDPSQFTKVKPNFFTNEQIRLVYETVRNEYLNSKEKVIPSNHQIWAMVSLVDTEKIVSKEALKLILSEDLSKYEDYWIDNKFKSWKASKFSMEQVKEAIDIIHGMNPDNDLNENMKIAQQLKLMFNNIDEINNDDQDLGDDFDDPESHKLKISDKKMHSGWNNIDNILNGGWDRATLSVLIGETNVGKCCVSDTYIKIKNKKTGEIKNIMIGDFFNLIKNNGNM